MDTPLPIMAKLSRVKYRFSAGATTILGLGHEVDLRSWFVGVELGEV